MSETKVKEKNEVTAAPGSPESLLAGVVDEPTETKPAEVKTDETTPAQAEQNEIAPAYIPGKKKGKWKWIVLALVAVAAIWFFFLRGNGSDSVGTTVAVIEAKNGSIEEIVTISGNVASAEKKSYYATISAPISSLVPKAGDRVEKGDLLFSYDTEELELMRRQAELNMQQANGTYSAAVEKNAKSTDVLRGNSIHDINNRLEEITAEIDRLNDLKLEKTQRMEGTIRELQATLRDLDQNGVMDGQEAAYAAAYDTKNGEEWKYDEYYQILMTEDFSESSSASGENRQLYLAVQQSLADKQYALTHDAELEKWDKEIRALNEEKARLTEQKSVEQGRLTGGDWNQLQASKELTELSANHTIEDIDEAAAGVTADFSGVVTSVGVNEGATVAKGTPVLTIESTDNVEVSFQIAKSDMAKVQVGQQVDITVNGNAYEGEVMSISGSATKNATGVPVVDARIRIKNPDDKLILGVEASNRIHTNRADGVIIVPYEIVGADADGDYVYVVDNGVVRRRNVTVGLTTSTQAEIKEGLSAGDLVITGDTDSLFDGLAVTVQTPDAG
ncbi:MAG: efflux RND transporter periplasmic adaptor subunit [Lachnospiraceae bacterium]|nr:efflux RND transporter periplasmic adaptor subunit [Lachnospiraceae bacterium]